MGNSRWYDVAPKLRPEAGLLAIRKGLGLFANIRPAYLYKELAEACPLKKEIIGDGFDMVIMRELTGGLYFGDTAHRRGGRRPARPRTPLPIMRTRSAGSPSRPSTSP